MLNPVKLITIDLDGTLIDSVPDLAYAADEMRKALNMPTWGEDKVREWVGNGVVTLTHRALTGELHQEADPDLFAKGYPIFAEVYEKHASERSFPYAGVVEALEWMKAEGYALACVTNKAARFTEPLLRDVGISDYFSIIVSGDTLPKQKPDPLPLLHIAEHFGIDPSQALMVGDSRHDVKAARAAGFQVACVSYGYNHGDDVSLTNPDAVIDSMVELKDLVSLA